jgi:hypothetical protein
LSYSQAVLATAGLIHYWKLDETTGASAADSAGTDALTIAGGVTLGADPLVPGGTAMTFSRAGSGRLSRATSYGTTGASYECWFRSSDATSDRQGILFNGSGSNGFGIFVNGGSTNGHLYYLKQSLAWNDTGYTPGTTRTHHLVLTMDGSATARIYVDAVLVVTFSGAPNTASGGFTVGGENSTGGQFSGTIDEVSVYSATLSAATILDHYLAAQADVPTIRPKPPAPRWQAGSAPPGVKLFLPLAEGPRPIQDAVRGTIGTLAGTLAWGSGRYGPQLAGFTTSNYAYLSPPAQILASTYPCWAAVLVDAPPGVGGWPFCQGVIGTGSHSVGIGWNDPATGSLSYRLNAIGNSVTTATGLPLNDGRPHVVAAWSNSATDHHLWFDGVEVATGTTDPGGTLSTPAVLIGVESFNPTRNPFGGAVIALALGNGSLPDFGPLAYDWLSGNVSAVRPRMSSALLSATTPPLEGSATLTATPTLGATGTAAYAAGATTLDGPAVLAAVGSTTIFATATLDGPPVLAVTGTAAYSALATLDAVATLDALATSAYSASATLETAGTLTADPSATPAVEGTATLAANGDLGATGTAVYDAVATLTAVASLRATGTVPPRRRRARMRPFADLMFPDDVVYFRVIHVTGSQGAPRRTFPSEGVPSMASVQTVDPSRSPLQGRVEQLDTHRVFTPTDLGAKADDKFLWKDRQLVVQAPTVPSGIGDVIWITHCQETR